LDCRFDYEHELLLNLKHWPVVLDYRGTRIAITVPELPDVLHHNSGSLNPKIVSLETLKTYVDSSGIKLPFELKPESGVRYVETRDSSYHNFNAEDSRWTVPARLVGSLNNWLACFGYAPLTTEVSNDMLARIQSRLAAETYVCEWLPDSTPISTVYHDDNEDRYSSCMSGKPTRYFELYDYLQRAGKLTMVLLKNGAGVFLGRALCWKGSNPDDLYLDRLYVPESHGSWKPAAVQAYKDFCAANNITKTVFGRTSDATGLEHKRISIEVGVSPSYFGAFPYVDSMCIFCSDKKLRNQHPKDVSVFGELRNTGGGWSGGCAEDDEDDDDNYVTTAAGDRIHRDDASYVERVDEYYPDDEVVYTRNGEPEVAEDCVRLDGGHYSGNPWAYCDDAIEAHDGLYILTEDAVELHNGDYAHIDETAELHDGGYALSGDCEPLHDDTYALREDCVELHDGRWALADDAVEIEGEWHLQSEVEAEDENENETTEEETAAV
jgi:hypothetical protein